MTRKEKMFSTAAMIALFSMGAVTQHNDRGNVAGGTIGGMKL